MWVGVVTLVDVLTLMLGSFFSFLSFLVGWVLALALGVLLSAPFFVNAPSDLSLASVRLWVPALEIPLLAWIFKILAFTGWWVLRGVWWLILRGRSTPKPAG